MVCLPAPSVIKPEEGEFVVDSGASLHMLSRNDLNSVELEAASLQKSDDGCKCQRRSANKRIGDSVCQGTGFIRDSDASRRYTCRSTRKSISAKITGIRTFGPVVRNHHSSKMADEKNAHGELRTDCLSMPSHSFSPTSPTSLPQEAVLPILHPASTRSESASDRVRRDPSRGPVETENSNKQQRRSTVRPVAWTSRNRKLRKQQRSTVRPVAWPARMVRRVYGELCGWKCSSP